MENQLDLNEQLNEELNEILTTLYHDYSDIIFKLAKKAFSTSTDADDVVQETYYRACKYKHKLPEVTNKGAWLVTIAKSVICTKIKDNNRYHRFTSEEFPDIESSGKIYNPNQEVEAKEFMINLRAALDSLSNQHHKRAWLLKNTHNKTIKYIAKELKKKPETIRRWNRATTKHLKKFLEKKGYSL